MPFVVYILHPSDVDRDRGFVANDGAGALELLGARDHSSEVPTGAGVKDAERDLFVDSGLHDAVDDLAVRAVSAKGDDSPHAACDRFLPYAQTVSPGLRELQIYVAERPTNLRAQLGPVLTDEAMSGHGIRND